MLDEKEFAGETVDTAATTPESEEKAIQENPVDNSQKQVQQKPVRQKLTPEQKEFVQDLMKKRVERSHQRFFERYGVKDLKGLDDAFGRASKYDEMDSKIKDLTTQNASLTEQLAFIRNNVNPEKYEDIRRYFKGGDIQFSEATLIEALGTHPEWIKQGSYNTVAKTTIQSLSPNRGHQIAESEDDKMKRVFGV